jgi:hypothetical protein
MLFRILRPPPKPNWQLVHKATANAWLKVTHSLDSHDLLGAAT